MIRKSNLIHNICAKLTILTGFAKVNNNLGLTDINHAAEDFYCGLLNIVLGQEYPGLCLENMNALKMNFPAVDLADLKQKICVQVTSTEGREKIQRTLDKYFENNLDEKHGFTRLIVLVIGEKPAYRKSFEVKGKLNFDHAEDVWDTPYLINWIDRQNLDVVERVDAYLRKHLDIPDQKAPAMNVILTPAMAIRNFVNRERELPLKTKHCRECFFRDLAELTKKLEEDPIMNRHPSKKEKALCIDQINLLRSCAQSIGLPEAVQRNIQQRCKKMELFLKKQSIEIAIAGSVKAGKSSLINALLDEEIAAVESTPETSVLTKYRTTESDNYIRVRFYTAGNWKEVWKDASKSQTYCRDYQEANAARIKAKWVGARPYYRDQLTIEELKSEVRRFTYSKSADHFFVQEVEVGICSDAFPADVFLVDTPGLDDVVKARSAVTRRYLNKADAVLACIKADSIHEASEAQFINRVMGNRRDKNSLFVVVTKKDQKSASDFHKDYNYFIRNVLNEMYNPDKKACKRINAANNCFGISALLYNEMRAFANGVLNTSDEDRFHCFLVMLFKLKYLSGKDIFIKAEELQASIHRCNSAVRMDSGIPNLKQQLTSRFIDTARNINQQKANAEFCKFRRDMDMLIEDQIGTLQEQLRPLDATGEELEQMRSQLEAAERIRSELQSAIATVRERGCR